MTAKSTLPTLEETYRARQGRPQLVDVPAGRFLLVDGEGMPGGPAFQEAVEALYAVAYGAKFALAKATGEKVKLMPLEGLYTLPGDAKFDVARRDELRWTLLLRLPEQVAEDLVEQAREQVARRKQLVALERVRVDTLDEGRCAQVLHVGPYAEEPATIELLDAFVREQGLVPDGAHHEIYLGDPRRVAPERLKTILRRPVA
jgi:hypothetical protein